MPVRLSEEVTVRVRVRVIVGEDPAPVRYRLCSVVLHRGELQSGHNTALVRRAGGWALCNDTVVRPGDTEFESLVRGGVCGDALAGTTAYLLFYERID